jgi:ABC-2 type transport system ATP-binding protein
MIAEGAASSLRLLSARSVSETAEPVELTVATSSAAPVMVSVSNLTKSYGRRVAVRDVSFDLAPGVTGLLGPNGAGKSTLVSCLVGLASWDTGEVRIDGIDPVWRARDARGSIGFMPERVSFPPEMAVEHYLRFVAEAKGVRRSERRAAIEAVLERAGLVGVRGRIISNLSKGYRQRVGLAQAILGEPPVLVLDEPSAGLDPLQTIEMRTVLQAYAQERTVLVSTHSLGEARKLCERVLVLSQGLLVYDGPAAGMTAAGAPRFRVRLSGRDNPPAAALGGPGTSVLEAAADGDEYELLVEADDRPALGRLVSRLTAAGCLVTGVEAAGDPLEDAFRQAVGTPA